MIEIGSLLPVAPLVFGDGEEATIDLPCSLLPTMIARGDATTVQLLLARSGYLPTVDKEERASLEMRLASLAAMAEDGGDVAATTFMVIALPIQCSSGKI
ncbi:hypothetical protein ACLOJK_007906 [Asimina triloba]